MTGHDLPDQASDLIAALNAGEVKTCRAVFGFPTFVRDAVGQFILPGERDSTQQNRRDRPAFRRGEG